MQTSGQFVHQEFRYIKIPDRRLLSGLLYVNVINHNDNDDQDDFMQQCHDHGVSNGIKYSSSFSADGTAFSSFQDRGREGMKHSFADYDCFVFHVAGGMTLHTDGIKTPESGVSSYNSLNQLQTAGYATGGGNWYNENGGDSGVSIGANATRTWVVRTANDGANPFGDTCSHFIKYHLLSRINNASGHGLQGTGSGPLYYKHRPMHRQTYKPASGTLPSQNSALQSVVTNEYVLSNGIYDDKDSHGTDLTMASYAKQSSPAPNNHFQRLNSDVRDNGEGQDNSGNPTERDGESYYTPVDTVKIYGKHHLVFESHPHHTHAGKVYSWQSSNAAHVTSHWDLVIDIGLRGNNPAANTNNGAAGQTDSDKSIIRPQINVSFQPFGETASFDISETPHTS